MRKREKTEMVTLRASPDFMALVDEWRRHQPDIPTRAEAIRRLVIMGYTDPSKVALAALTMAARSLDAKRPEPHEIEILFQALVDFTDRLDQAGLPREGFADMFNIASKLKSPDGEAPTDDNQP